MVAIAFITFAVFACGWVSRALFSSPAAPPSRSVTTSESAQFEGVAAQMREILLRPDLMERVAGVAGILPRLGPESLDAVLAAYDSVSIDAGDVELILLADWWASFDPEAAETWSLTSWRAAHPGVRTAVFRAWGRSQPETAVLRAALTQGERIPYLRAAVTGWDESGRPGLFELLRDMGATADRQMLADAMVRRRVLREGPEATFAWAEALPEDEDSLKLHVFQRVASTVADFDPERAAGWASKHAGQPYAWDLPRRVGRRWAKRDPKAAMAWLASLPPSRGRDVGVREAYLVWLQQDRAGALAFVSGSEIEPWLDPAVSLYAKALINEGPARAREAADWAARISEPNLRDTTTILVGRAWLLADAEAAEKWAAEAELSDLVRQKMHEIPARQRRRARAGGAPPSAPSGDAPADQPDPWGPILPED
jgi:hypothetical protein